jgi:hypothetical protein
MGRDVRGYPDKSGSYFTPNAVPRYPTPMRSRTARADTASCFAALFPAAAPVHAERPARPALMTMGWL